jgi:hypothetical protein
MAERILFEHINFHGEHKHLFTSEPDLNAIDNFFSMIRHHPSLLSLESGSFPEMLIIAGPIPIYLGPASTTRWKMLAFPTIPSRR